MKTPQEKLKSLISHVKFAMLTTQDSDGHLRSRPMATQKIEFDGDLWFFSGQQSPKIHEIEKNPDVNVSYADPDSQVYVSISGQAERVVNRTQMERLWSPAYRAWFPQGLDDPDLCLIRIHVNNAEYWDTHSSTMVHLFGLAKSLATGKRHEPGDHQKVKLA